MHIHWVRHTNQKEHTGSLKCQLNNVTPPLKELYGFVDCSNRRRPSDSNIRRFVRAHVMHNYRRQKQIDALDAPLVLSTERWSEDPFDSFPIKMPPQMHALLNLCKSTTPQSSAHMLQISQDIPCT